MTALVEAVTEAALAAWKRLGPGRRDAAYAFGLAAELGRRHLRVDREEGGLIVENRLPVGIGHDAGGLVERMKRTGRPVGLRLEFGVRGR